MGYYDQSVVVRTRTATPWEPEISQNLPYVTGSGLGKTGGSKDVIRTKNYYNTARSTIYSRYTPQDWGLSNQLNFSLSDQERAFGEKIRAESWRAIEETDAKTTHRQQDVTKKLGQRICDIAYWKTELQNEINSLATENEKLKEYCRKCERALADTANPLHIAEECLMHRETRQGIDLVNDDVEKSLVKEVAVINRCKAKMNEVLKKGIIQLKMNRAAQHTLEIDAKDKHHAQTLDDRIQAYRNGSAGTGYYPGIENIDNTITVPETWVKYTQENIERSQKEEATSEALRGEIDRCLRQCSNEMWKMFNAVNNAFNARIRETADTKNRLLTHFQRTMAEIFDMERNIELLRRAIQDKEPPMKVAQTRLDERTRRINAELCNDPVMKSLQREVSEIRESVRILRERLKASDLSLARLMKIKATLEHDISVKEDSLRIDSQYCMGMRKRFPFDTKDGPISKMPIC